MLDYEHIGQLMDVKILPSAQAPEIAPKKQSILDILCQDQQGIQYIIEMQVAKTKGFEKRAQYYAAKAYSDQLLAGQGVENLREVVFVAITDFIMFLNKTSVKSDHIILDRKTKGHDLRDFCFTFIELPKFKKEIDALEGHTEKWYYYLKHGHETDGKLYKTLLTIY